MDKQTLSNYGWLTIVTLILAVMLAFATPFGNYVGDAVVNVANGFVGTSNNATDKDNLSQNEVEWAIKTDYGIGYKEFRYYNNLKDVEVAINNSNFTNGKTKLSNNSIVIAISTSEIPVVRLLGNQTLTQEIAFTKGIILDINGHMIEMSDLSTAIALDSLTDDFKIVSLHSNGKINSTNCYNPLMVTTSQNIEIKNITINNTVNKTIDAGRTIAIGCKSSTGLFAENVVIDNLNINTNSIIKTSATIISRIKNLEMKKFLNKNKKQRLFW